MNAQPKRRGRPPKVQVASYADMGPRIVHEPLPGAATARVVAEDRADPDKPQGTPVRGARAVIVYEWLHAQRLLTDEQREAADRYLARLEQASGAMDGARDRNVEAGRNTGLPGGPTDRQVAALADLRDADEVLGRDRDMVREVVGWNREPEHGLNVAQFRTALQRLAEWWRM